MKRILIYLIFGFSFSMQAQYAIGVKDSTVVDVSRSSRNIQTYFYYPANISGTGVPLAIPPAGGFPVVVVAHGFSMDYAAFTNFRDSLVPKGYIVLIPNTETGIIGVSHGNFGADLSFLVNFMQQQNSNVSSRYYGKVRNKSAIIGHSMGGGATYLGANGNSNVTTTVTFSAAETSPSAISACAGITVPSLVFAGQNDCVAPQAGNQTPMYNALNSSCKTKIVINNGGHCQYSNSSFTCDFGEGTCRGTSTILTRAQQQPIVFDYLYKWLDFYLRGNCAAFSAFQNLLSVDTRVSYSQSCSYSLPNAFILNADANIKCKEDTANLFVATGFTSYLWSNSAVDSSINARSAGTYFAVVTDFMGCTDTSNTINIVNRVAEHAALSPSGVINVCGLTPTIAVSAAGTNLTDYRWNTSDTGIAITVTGVGNYFVSTLDTFGCLGYSDTLSVVNVSAIAPIINPSDTIEFCPYDSVIFSLSPIFDSITWRDGSSDSLFIAYESEFVYATAIDSNGCVGYSDTIYVIKLPPPMPSILWNIDSLVADSGYVSYTWYNDINELVSTDRIFYPLVNARAFVLVVVDANGCMSERVASLFYFSTSIADNSFSKLHLAPNPCTDFLMLSNLEANEQIEIYDYAGNAIASYGPIINSTMSIPVSHLANGLYFIKLKNESREQNLKFIKQ